MNRLTRPKRALTRLNPRLIPGFVFLAFTVFFCPAGDSQRAFAQATQEKALNVDFFPEAGCPIALSSVRSVLDIDPFGAPTASKIYLTYQNNSSSAVTAVKFRCRYSDAEGKDRGTFHAIDSFNVAPGQSRSHKWKRESALYPKISGFQIRVLQVKLADGTLWESVKMQELANQQNSGGEDVSQSSGGQPGVAVPSFLERQQNAGGSQMPPQSDPQAQQQPVYEQSQPQEQQQQGYDKGKELPW